MPRPTQDPKRIVADAYDQIAERYLEWRAQEHRDELAGWVTLLGEHLPSGAGVLDLGCGAGVPLTKLLAERFDVTGVDISARQIELARRNVPNARFIHADMTALELPIASFDAAVGAYSLIHVPRAQHVALFHSISRWLRAGGLLLANFGTGNWEVDYEEDWLGAPMFWSSFDAEGERVALKSAGYELVIDRIETIIEDDRLLSFLLILARQSGPTAA